MHERLTTIESQRLSVRVVDDIGRFGRVVPGAKLVTAVEPIAERGLPAHLKRNEHPRGATRFAEIQCVSGQEISWIVLISSKLHITEVANQDLEPSPPLAHGPVVPITADDIAWRGTAERQIHEFARKGCEIQARVQTPDLPVQHSVEIFLIVPELGPAPSLSAAIDLLDLLKRTEICIGREIAAVAIGDRNFELRLTDSEKLLKVERCSERPLIGIPP